MGSPYRTAPTTDAALSPRDRGIVGDIIEQFSDRFAFLRELVQNAIDADTPSVSIELSHDESEQLLRVRVEDRGVGMTREIIESRLLVLFRSTKEHDDTKIGKFGIGFASVLAVRPNVIRVDTRHAGVRHVLHLYPDLSYELFDAGRARDTGTVVEIEIAVATDRVAGFVTASRDALRRWCRHASVPITIRATDAAGAELLNARIDRPLSLPSPLVEVHATSKDGATKLVVGVLQDARPYAGFFNHGLTLHETSEPFLGRLAFKIQDARLGHTLSRDNIRRDRSFERALEFARSIAERALPGAAASALRDAAESSDRSRFAPIFQSLIAARVALTKSQWVFPIVDPVGERLSVDAAELAACGAWAAGASSLLTAGLASGGVPVLDLNAPGDRSLVAPFVSQVEALTGKKPRDVHADLVLVSPIEMAGSDRVLIDQLEMLLDAVYRKPSAIIMAELSGANANAVYLAGGPRRALFAGSRPDSLTDPWVLDSRESLRNPFGLLGRDVIVLNTRSNAVAAARRRAETAASVAAGLLVRLLLLRVDKLSEDRSADLLDRGLAEMLEALS